MFLFLGCNPDDDGEDDEDTDHDGDDVVPEMVSEMMQHGTAGGITGFLKERMKPQKPVGDITLAPIPGMPGAVVPLAPR